jgi:hypothetical protein
LQFVRIVFERTHSTRASRSFNTAQLQYSVPSTQRNSDFGRNIMARTSQTSAFIFGVLLMGLGGIFLIAQIFGGNFWAYFWPYPIIALGIAFFAGMVDRGRGAGGLAIPGSIITTIGLLLFLQNSFGWWESWAFAWTFIVISVGVGLIVMGYWNGKEKPQRVGLMIAGIGTALLFLFGTFFGLGFSFLGFRFAARVIWPLLLIGAGAFLALRGLITFVQNSGDSTSALPAAPANSAPVPPAEQTVTTPTESVAIQNVQYAAAQPVASQNIPVQNVSTQSVTMV